MLQIQNDATLEQRLDDAVTAYLEEIEAGRAPCREEWLARHPDLAVGLAAFFADTDRVRSWTEPLSQVAQEVRAKKPGGTRFGDYELLGEIGRGGKGVVYKALQISLNRTVALKMVRIDQFSEEIEKRRLRNEAETAALLDHPRVVPVYEVGELDGQLYFSMKLFTGGTLADWIRNRFTAENAENAERRKSSSKQIPRQTSLSPSSSAFSAPSAVNLLIAIARAVQHAHARGVLHRDLKPSNILLDEEGQPHVADFGLARRLETDSGLTRTGAIVGTPSYMAPEQTQGDRRAVTTAADVYGLGCIFYALLTGGPPFVGDDVLSTIMQVRDRAPEPPSRRNPRVGKDLSTICLKCLEKDPQRRYPSAEALADDLERFLAGKPILARPAGAVERLWKWTRRRPAAAGMVLTGGLSVLALAAGVVVHNLQMHHAVERAERNEGEAIRQREIALDRYRSASDTMKRMVDRLGGRGQTSAATRRELRRVLLEDSLGFYQKVLEYADDPDPAIRLDVAGTCLRTAAIQDELGQPGPAKDNLLRAIGLVEGLPAEVRDQTAAQNCLADCFSRMGGRDSNGREGVPWQQKSLAIRERLAERFPDDSWYQSELARAHHVLATILQNSQQQALAERHYQRAIDVREQIVRDHPRAPAFQGVLAGSYQNLALLYAQTGRRREANDFFDKSARLLRPLVHGKVREEEYLEARDNRLTLIALCSNWSPILTEFGKRKEAIAVLDEGVALAELEVKQEPADETARGFCLSVHGARAQALEGLKQYARSIKDWDRAIELSTEQDRPFRRLQRALTRIHAGEHEQAATEARDVAGSPGASDETLFFSACVLSLASGYATQDTHLDAPRRSAAVERHACEAVAILSRLKSKGYFKSPEMAAELRESTDLNPLRERADFKKLLEK